MPVTPLRATTRRWPSPSICGKAFGKLDRPTAMQLYIVRHAEPDYANDSLTPAGQLEAEALAVRMTKHLRPEVLYSSPLGRARATMRPTAEAMGLQGTILDWAGELNLPAPAGPWGVASAQWDVP